MQYVNAIQYTYRFSENSTTKVKINVAEPYHFGGFDITSDLPKSDTLKTETLCLPTGAKGHPWDFSISSAKRLAEGEDCIDSPRATTAVELSVIKLVTKECP